MKRILPLLLCLAAAPALAHKDHDDDAPVIKPQQMAPKAGPTTPSTHPKKATKPTAATPPATTAEPAAKPKTGG